MMRREFRIPEQIEEFNSVLDSAWFDLTTVEFQNGLLSINVEREELENPKTLWQIFGMKFLEIRTLSCLLRLSGISALAVEDSQGIGKYDFCELKIIGDLYSFKSGIPCKFEFKTSGPVLAILDCSAVVKTKKRIGI